LSGNDLSNPVDLTAIIDCSGAWMPGHNFDGTPTVILIARRRRPVGESVRAVLGIRDDSTRLEDPASGPVWSEIVRHVDDNHFEGTYVTVADLSRELLASHPWSLSGGGAVALVSAIEQAPRRL